MKEKKCRVRSLIGKNNTNPKNFARIPIFLLEYRESWLPPTCINILMYRRVVGGQEAKKIVSGVKKTSVWAMCMHCTRVESKHILNPTVKFPFPCKAFELIRGHMCEIEQNICWLETRSFFAFLKYDDCYCLFVPSGTCHRLYPTVLIASILQSLIFRIVIIIFFILVTRVSCGSEQIFFLVTL